MNDPYNYKRGRTAGPRLRCFLNAGLPLVLAAGLGGATRAHAASACPPPPDMTMSRLQGTVVGPSGVPVPQIVVKVLRDGIPLNQAVTDNKGRFEFKGLAPGNVNVRIQFLGTKSLDLHLRIKRGGLFHTSRLHVVLGLSGTRCSFATTSNRQFKDQMKKYSKQLEENFSAP